MDNAKKKELREQYNNRHPEMGIVCWQCDDEMWVDMSTDANADYKDINEDHTDDLKILLMDFLEEHPDAKPMRMKFKL